MKEKISFQLFKNEAVTRVYLDGTEYIVIPVIAAKEMVMNRRFYSAEELAMTAPFWNGRPITLNHPQEDSANTTQYLETIWIGHFFNVTFTEEKELKGEMWIRAWKLEKLSTSTFDRIVQGEALNVSTGGFADHEPKKGVHNGDEYDFILHNIMPDHLALLPWADGACSVADGCGTVKNHAEKSCCGSCKEGKACEGKNKQEVEKNMKGEVKKHFAAFLNAFMNSDSEGDQAQGQDQPNQDNAGVEATQPEAQQVQNQGGVTVEQVQISKEEFAFFNQLKAEKEASLEALRNSVLESNPKLTMEMIQNMSESVLKALVAEKQPVANADNSLAVGESIQPEQSGVKNSKYRNENGQLII